MGHIESQAPGALRASDWAQAVRDPSREPPMGSHIARPMARGILRPRVRRSQRNDVATLYRGRNDDGPWEPWQPPVRSDGAPITRQQFKTAARLEVQRRRETQPNPTITRPERYPVERLVDWRIYETNCVEILVEWADGSEDSWEPEEILHLDAPSLVLNFWRRHKGRCSATRLEVHHVLKILEQRTSPTSDGPEYRCQWVGYPASKNHTTWLSWDTVTGIALAQWVEFVCDVNVY
ncbi:hypothetical protein F53441_3160 [Fusarium austroafricanum]|uniref:Chromo domain-containing protein n=1 Tax=Fusarium austroafricanum TaxID=2364996 RepID=A0A8H4KQN9_9HYPO|nr:hypothetical protein F53441_3160 [Fusarium austroafricanum]